MNSIKELFWSTQLPVKNAFQKIPLLFDDGSDEQKTATDILAAMIEINNYLEDVENARNFCDYYNNINKDINKILNIFIESKAKFPYGYYLKSNNYNSRLNLGKWRQLLESQLNYNDIDFINIMMFLILQDYVEIYNKEVISDYKTIILNYMNSYCDPVKMAEYVFSLVNFLCNQEDAVVAFKSNASKVLEIVESESIEEKNIALVKAMQDIEELREGIKKINEENHNRIVKLSEKIEVESQNNKKSIITIVGLISTIIPFLTVNLSVLVNTFNLAILFAVNGTLFILLSVIIFFINKLVGNEQKVKWWVFLLIGIILIVISGGMIVIACHFPIIAEYIFPKRI